MSRRALHLPAMIAAAALAACLVALLAIPKEAGAAFPGENGRIAFSSLRTTSQGNSSAFQVVTIFADGTGERQLTGENGSGAAVSADGTKIAYSGNLNRYESDNEIYVMDRFGNGKKALTGNDLPEYGPAWSPDGSKIAFVRQERVTTSDGQFVDWQVDVWVMNANGSGQRKLTDDFITEGGPTWSPDGSKIAFPAPTGRGYDIWTIKPDGTGRRNVTNTPDASETGPDFSPDGKKLAFASKGRYNQDDIYTMNLDGSALTNVTDSRYLDEEGGAWSPSGARIAYNRNLPSNPADIFVKNADGSGRPKNVSNSPELLDSGPDWGPKPATTAAP